MPSHPELLQREIQRLDEIAALTGKSYGFSDTMDARLGAWIGGALRVVERVVGADAAAQLAELHGRKAYPVDKVAALRDLVSRFHDELLDGGPDPHIADDLDASATKISDPDVRDFVEESVRCYKGGNFRAAIVLSWVGALARLLAHVVAQPALVTAINAEGQRRWNATNPRPWYLANDAEGLTQKGERAFLDILDTVGAITGDRKAKLVDRLDERNSCGHPNPGRVGPRAASHHIEVLIDHVFSVC